MPDRPQYSLKRYFYGNDRNKENIQAIIQSARVDRLQCPNGCGNFILVEVDRWKCPVCNCMYTKICPKV